MIKREKFFAEHQEIIDRSKLEVFASKIGQNLLRSMEKQDNSWNGNQVKTVYAPHNPITGVYYSGINFLQLTLADQSVEDPRWFTPKGIKDLDLIEGFGAEKEYIVHVGAKEFKPVISTETGEHLRDEDGKLLYDEFERDAPSFTAHALTSGADLGGLNDFIEPVRDEDYVNAKLYTIIRNSGATVKHGVEESYYDFREDVIYLKSIDNYKDSAEYYTDALNKLGDWASHTSRLNREDAHTPIGSEAYFRNELVNQINSFMLSVKTGAEFTPEQFKDYAEKWKGSLETDPIQILTASSAADKINKYLLNFEFQKGVEFSTDKPFTIIATDDLARNIDGTIKPHSEIAFERIYPNLADSVKAEEFFQKYTLEEFRRNGANGELDKLVKSGGVPLTMAVLRETAKEQGYEIEIQYNELKNTFTADVVNSLGAKIGLSFDISEDKGIVAKPFDRNRESYSIMATTSPHVMSKQIYDSIVEYRNEMKFFHNSIGGLQSSFLGGKADVNSIWATALTSDASNNPVRTMINGLRVIRNEDMNASISNFNDQINIRVQSNDGFTGIELNIDKSNSKAFFVVNGEKVNDYKFDGKLSQISKKFEPIFENYKKYEKELLLKSDSLDRSKSFSEIVSEQLDYGRNLESYAFLQSNLKDYLKKDFLNSEARMILENEPKKVSFQEIEQGERFGLSIVENGKPIGVVLYAGYKDSEVNAIYIDPYSTTEEPYQKVYNLKNGLDQIFVDIKNDRQALKNHVFTDIERIVSFISDEEKRDYAQIELQKSFLERPMKNNMAYAVISAENSLVQKGYTPKYSVGAVKATDGEVRSYINVAAKEIPSSQMHIRVHSRGNEELIINNVRAENNVAPNMVRGIAVDSKAIDIGILRVDQMNLAKNRKISSDRTWLDIPIDEKEVAKDINRKVRGGLAWDDGVKSWYVKAGKDVSPFSRWENRGYNPTASAEESFVAKLREHGFIISVKDLVENNGKFIRCRVEGDSKHVKSGSYKFFPAHMNRNRAGGLFVNFKHGSDPISWYDKHQAKALTPEEKNKLALINEIRVEKETRKINENYAVSSKIAQKLWSESSAIAHTHGYVEIKQIANHSALRVVPDTISQEAYDLGVRLADNDSERFVISKAAERSGENVQVFVKGELLIPAMDIDGKITSLQKINQTVKYDKSGEQQFGSNKYFIKNSEKTAKFYTTDGKVPTGRAEIIIAEGYATADAVARFTGKTVVVAFDAGNINNVAHEFRHKYPDASITIAADNDHAKEREGKGNAGVYHATMTAKDVGGIVIIPPFKESDRGTDWNDYLLEHGVTKTKEVYLSLRQEAMKNFELSHGKNFSHERVIEVDDLEME